MYCDNSAIVFFSKNDKYSKSAKHVKLKYFVVKEEVQKQRMSIEHISTNLMITYPLTKGLSPKTFIEHVECDTLYPIHICTNKRKKIRIN